MALRCLSLIIATAALLSVAPAYSQAPAAAAAGSAPAGAPRGPTRPPLFFEENWKQIPQGGENPATLDSNGNPNLDLKMYAPNGQLLMSGTTGDENNPPHMWTGMCTTPCAVALRDKQHLADLSGLARLRWNTKISGFHQLRPLVKLADGTYLVGDRADGSTRDWLTTEVSYSDLRWVKLDMARIVVTGQFLDKVDLSKVDEIGFVDLMPGSGHGAGGWADVAQFQVYGKSVAR